MYRRALLALGGVLVTTVIPMFIALHTLRVSALLSGTLFIFSIAALAFTGKPALREVEALVGLYDTQDE